MKFEEIPILTPERWNAVRTAHSKDVERIIGRTENGVVATTHRNISWTIEPNKMSKEAFEQFLETFVNGEKAFEEKRERVTQISLERRNNAKKEDTKKLEEVG